MMSISLIATVGILACVVPCQCGQWVTYRGSQYKVSDTTFTWDAAITDCQNQGAYLAEVNSYCENQFIKEIAQGTGENIRIGGHMVNGVWTWATSGGTFDANNGYWGAGEPNGSGDCLHLWEGISHKWDDVSCSLAQKHICEKAAE